MGKAKFTVGVPNLPRAQALIDGSVRLPDFDLDVKSDFKEVGDRHDAMLEGTVDAAEMSTATFIQTRVLGQAEPQLAIPVFFVRGLRQRNIIVNRESGLTHPSDLKGKRIAVSRFSATTIVWVAGLLEEEYGVPMESVHWITAEEEHIPIENPRVKFEHLHANRRILYQMLTDREIDAAIFPGNDDYCCIYGGGHIHRWIEPYPKLKTLVEDPAFVLEYWKRERIYPIIHLITIKESVVREYPDFAPQLLKAFRAAKEKVFDYVDEEGKRRIETERNDLGWDPYLYELGDIDRRTMERLISYMVDQRLINRKVEIEELFAPGCI